MDSSCCPGFDHVTCVSVYILPGLQGDPGSQGTSADTCSCARVQPPQRPQDEALKVRDMVCCFSLELCSDPCCVKQ